MLTNTRAGRLKGIISGHSGLNYPHYVSPPMNLLGWTRAPEESLAQWDEHTALAAAVRRDGLTRTLVCGMGGSSLVADVLAETFGAKSLHALDSTNPDAVRAAASSPDLARTLFVISSKSGNTVETLAFCHYFAARARPEQFIAITETGSPLDKVARAQRFRAVIPHPPDVGGRYSALTAVGMVPAALSGLDGRALLERTRGVDIAAARSLGAAIAARAKSGRDKLYLNPPPRIAALAYWIEQLVAESSGKDGRGVVPIVQNPAGGALPDAWSEALGCATTLGIGPRYLHATGQLHKGVPNSGLFLVITTDIGEDLDIPEMGWTFGQLHHAQARGDVRALLARGRRVAHVHLSSLAEISQLHPPPPPRA